MKVDEQIDKNGNSHIDIMCDSGNPVRVSRHGYFCTDPNCVLCREQENSSIESEKHIRNMMAEFNTWPTDWEI